MHLLHSDEVTTLINRAYQRLHQQQMQTLKDLKLSMLLSNCNAYTLAWRDQYAVESLVRSMIDAQLHKEEELFVDSLLKDLAILICGKVFDGHKSTAEGIDLEFFRDSTLYLVAIKSGQNWGNSSQIARMRENFNRAMRIYRTNNPTNVRMVAVNGCCYGKDNQPDKGDYFKYCGQRFWELISGNAELYTQIIEPLGHRAREHNEQFLVSYDRVISKFTLEFIKHFCNEEGIDWGRLLRYNSAA